MLSVIKKAGSLLALALILFVAVMSIEQISFDDVKMIMNWQPVNNLEGIDVSIVGTTDRIGINDTVVLRAVVGDKKTRKKLSGATFESQDGGIKVSGEI